MLRAVAALAVVVGHVPFAATDLPAVAQGVLSGAVRLGRMGVPLFLVLSGFCIHLAVARRMAAGQGVRSDWGPFWKRRFWRLYPPYLAAIVLSLAVYGVIGPGRFAPFERVVALPWDLVAHLLLVHNLFADYCFSLGNGPFWTLGLEEQLYALYALFLALRRRWPLGRVVCLVLLTSLAWQCGWHGWTGTDEGAAQPTLGPAPVALGQWLKWPIGLWFAWVLGAVAAEAHAGAICLPGWCSARWLAAGLLVAGVATSHTGLGLLAAGLPGTAARSALGEGVVRVLSGFSDLSVSGAAFVVLNRWVRREGRERFRGRLAHALAGLGVMSYSLYLTHVPIQRFLGVWLPGGPTLGCWLLRLAVLLPACLGFAALFFWLVERHFLGRAAAPVAGTVAGARHGSRPPAGGTHPAVVKVKSDPPFVGQRP
jgi:peptidoglycan/LPS O-acetylase OafA/YrhL